MKNEHPKRRMKSVRWTLVLGLLGVAAAGCGTDPADVPLDGRWSGSATWSGWEYEFTLELSADEGIITGAWRCVVVGFGTLTGSVTGSYLDPNVVMELAGTEEGFAWAGTLTSDDVLTGHATHSGGGGFELSFSRE